MFLAVDFQMFSQGSRDETLRGCYDASLFSFHVVEHDIHNICRLHVLQVKHYGCLALMQTVSSLGPPEVFMAKSN